jgi:hypothetical protein
MMTPFIFLRLDHWRPLREYPGVHDENNALAAVGCSSPSRTVNRAAGAPGRLLSSKSDDVCPVSCSDSECPESPKAQIMSATWSIHLIAPAIHVDFGTLRAQQTEILSSQSLLSNPLHQAAINY